ncbi:MAG: hypothetical protein KDA21_07620, partial [Phycisphaerales bacterium]|nr:hypothetical protein [Phycisphaerales bacterium]
MSKNTGASRAALNTLSRRAPREYIVIVGAPTNFFNGYYTFVGLQEALRRGEPPDGSWDFQVAGPDPRTRREIDWYLDFTPKALPIAADAPDHVWKQHGWSRQARDELKKRSWRPEQTMSWPSSTHDLYWGNFIDPAMRLYQFEAPFTPPLTRPRPQPGDILTYLVYHPGYLLRDTIDFDASPHNMEHRHKPDAAYIWNPGGTPSGPARWSPPSDQASRAALFPPGQAKFAEMSLDEQAGVLARAG